MGHRTLDWICYLTIALKILQAIVWALGKSFPHLSVPKYIQAISKQALEWAEVYIKMMVSKASRNGSNNNNNNSCPRIPPVPDDLVVGCLWEKQITYLSSA